MRIEKRIKASKKEYDTKSQRIELLKRTEEFLDELVGIKSRFGTKFFRLLKFDLKEIRKISKQHILLKLDYPKENIFITDLPIEEVEESLSWERVMIYGHYDEYKIKRAIKKDSYFDSRDLNTVVAYDVDPNDFRARIECKWIVLERYLEKWTEFLKRWHIGVGWDGRLSSLNKYQLPLIEVELNEKERHLPIQIKMSSWIREADFKEIWNDIKQIQKSIFDKKKKGSDKFSRHLCWYDLNKNPKYGRKKPREIALLWAKLLPDEVDLFTIEYMLSNSETISDLKKIIKAKALKDLEGRKLESREILKEMKHGRLISEYGDYFKETREFYVTGRTERKKVSPPFVKTIERAIKRMEEYINISEKAVKGIEKKRLFEPFSLEDSISQEKSFLKEIL